MQANPKISVIIPAYNEEDYLGRCLDSLLDQDIDPSWFEIIVVDNNSTDKTTQIAREKHIQVLQENRKGVIFASMTGAKHARAPIIAFTDADCRVPKNWLRMFLRHFKGNPKIDAAGGIFTFFDGSFFLKTWAYLVKPLNWHLIGGNYAIKKQTLKRLGWFTPAINFGFDVALTLQLQKHGSFIIDKSLVVETSSRRYSYNLPQTLFLYLINDLSLCLLKQPFRFDFTDIRIRNLQRKKSILFYRVPNSLLYACLFLVMTVFILFSLPTLTNAKTVFYQQAVEFIKTSVKPHYENVTGIIEKHIKP